MFRGIKDLNPDDFKSFIPSDEEILRRKDKWEALMEKFSNCNDGEEDGIDMDEFGEEEEDYYEDEEETAEQPVDADSEDEAIVDNLDTQMVSFCTGSETFGTMPREQQRELITVSLSPKLIEQLRAVISRRMAELGHLNLPFWEVSNERVQSTMSHDERYFETPALRFGSRSGQSLMDLQRTIALSRGNPNLNLNNVTINGIPASQGNNFKMSTHSNDLPSAIQSLCKMNMKFSLKITEREYDVEVHGRNLPRVLERLNIPHSASLNSLDAITISSDDEEPLEKEPLIAQETLMKNTELQVKTEPKDKAVEVPKDPKPKGKATKATKAPKPKDKATRAGKTSKTKEKAAEIPNDPKPKDKATKSSKAPKPKTSSKDSKLIVKFKPWYSDDEQSRDVADDEQRRDVADAEMKPVDDRSSDEDGQKKSEQTETVFNQKKPTGKTVKESESDQNKLQDAKNEEKVLKKNLAEAKKASKKLEKASKKEAKVLKKKATAPRQPKAQKEDDKSKVTEYYKFPGDSTSSNGGDDDSCSSNYGSQPTPDEPSQKRRRDLH